MAFDETLAGRIRDAVARKKNITAKKMFGGLCFLLNGNLLVGVWKSSLVARLGPAAEMALREPDVRTFDITGKPMRNWVVVEPDGIEDDNQLMGWIERAMKFVKTLPKKPTVQGLTKAQKPTDIDGYISQFPADIQVVLENIRETIRRGAPEATEVISYQMPAFKQHGILVYFAAWQNHIGFYPPISGDPAIEKAAVRYAGPEGNLQFPLDEPMPLALIERIVKLRVKQDSEKAAVKKPKRKAK